MLVRRMNPQEFDSTMNLFHMYRDEAIETVPEIEFEYDENSMIDTMRRFSSNGNYCWYNLYDNTRPVGFIAGMASGCLWNDSLFDAHIAFVFIHPSYRNMDNFRLLFKEFEYWAREVGAKRMTGGDIGINPERTRKLYEHFGFKAGVWLGKELSE